MADIYGERATTPTISSSNITMGTSATITLAPASPTFKHKLKYSFAGASNLVDGLSIGSGFSALGNTTVTFTPPISLGEYIPTLMSSNATLYCTTYDESGKQIGDIQKIALTINVPSYTPTVSVDIVGDNLLSGDYVQNKSYATVMISGSGKYGSVIQSYITEVDGITYFSDNFPTVRFTSGTKTFAVKVIDSRGQEAIDNSNTIYVYPYATPSITSFTASRGTNETTVSARLVGSVSSVNNKNTSSLTIELNGVTKTVTSGETVTFTGLDTDKTYTAIARVTDYYATVARSISISTVDVTMDFNASGKGVALGKVSEKDAFEVNMNTEFLKGVSIKDLLASWEELNHSKGVTSNIQDQLNNKAPLVHTHNEYGKLAIATETTLGSIMVGDNLIIDENGRLSAIGGGSEHPTYNTTQEVLSGSALLSWGGNFDVVNELQTDNGHVTRVGKERYKLPSNVATFSADGLMSKEDKAKLDSFKQASEYASFDDIVSYTLAVNGNNLSLMGNGEVVSAVTLPNSGGTTSSITVTDDGDGNVTLWY